MAVDEKFCAACGADRDTETRAAALEAKNVRDTRASLIALAGFYVFVGAIFALFFRHKVTPAGLWIVLAAHGALAVFHLGLWAWAKRSPLPPAIVALVMWISLQGVVIAINPMSLLQTYALQIGFGVVLIKAIQSGMHVHKLRAGRRA
jgi:4-amino-4-deoxy-L-arabinose transferase-like glycosyltransferase